MGKYASAANYSRIKYLIDLFLNSVSLEEGEILSELSKLEETHGSGIYSHLLEVLAQVYLPESEGQSFWQNMLEHKRKLETSLGRKVDFRVAISDYLLTENPRIQYPRVMELQTFLDTTRKAQMDELTSCYNHRFFWDRLETECSRSRRYNREVSLIIVDIDDFKKINDSLGHAFGDSVLRYLASILKANTRKTDFVCRVGGEEFGIIMPETSLDGAFRASEKMRLTFEKSPLEETRLSFSGGISSYPLIANDARELFNGADRSLYLSKESGKNQNRIAMRKQE